MTQPYDVKYLSRRKGNEMEKWEPVDVGMIILISSLPLLIILGFISDWINC